MITPTGTRAPPRRLPRSQPVRPPIPTAAEKQREAWGHTVPRPPPQHHRAPSPKQPVGYRPLRPALRKPGQGSVHPAAGGRSALTTGTRGAYSGSYSRSCSSTCSRCCCTKLKRTHRAPISVQQHAIRVPLEVGFLTVAQLAARFVKGVAALPRSSRLGRAA